MLIAGRWKLLVSQPHFSLQQPGWKGPDGTWRPPHANETFACMLQDVPPSVSALPVPNPNASVATPCLFDVEDDAGEHVDCAATNASLVDELWALLNLTIAGQRDCNGWSYEGTNASIPGPTQPDGTKSCSPPDLLGSSTNRSQQCAKDKWRAYGSADGPLDGVPGCDDALGGVEQTVPHFPAVYSFGGGPRLAAPNNQHTADATNPTHAPLLAPRKKRAGLGALRPCRMHA